MHARPTPFYFGPLGRRLFGSYHPPAGGAPARELGLVLCAPQGHEYIQFHRAFRQLALALSQAGYPVLRFDFSGCGDSEGDESIWELGRWRDDLVVAIEELKQQSRATRIGLVGLRLGATLACEVAASRADVDTLVLWDPVAGGAEYLDELSTQHRRMLGYAHVIPKADRAANELLGFALPDAFAKELATADLTALEQQPAGRVLVVESNPAVSQAGLVAHLSSLGAEVERSTHSDPNLWVWVEDFGKVHVPRKLLEGIESWVSGARA